MEVRNIFDVANSAMSAQLVRLNTVSSNMANIGSVSATEEGAYRALRPVFETVYADEIHRSGLATARIKDVVQSDRAPVQSYRPDHPLADPDGFVWEAVINPEEEMVEMMEASRQYENILETVSTLRMLMARTVKMGE
jgi:flagellar basal-body rod protein FlgC